MLPAGFLIAANDARSVSGGGKRSHRHISSNFYWHFFFFSAPRPTDTEAMIMSEVRGRTQRRNKSGWWKRSEITAENKLKMTEKGKQKMKSAASLQPAVCFQLGPPFLYFFYFSKFIKAAPATIWKWFPSHSCLQEQLSLSWTEAEKLISILRCDWTLYVLMTSPSLRLGLLNKSCLPCFIFTLIFWS